VSCFAKVLRFGALGVVFYNSSTFSKAHIDYHASNWLQAVASLMLCHAEPGEALL
jgi:hypothetical protein